ncbi:PadR family transcriptional regulator [Candidatus Thorarchaeota archaeon]|jgi:DNA-binding PadR family transcriptional regulator|nr:MAG: PadR family transcriptional regulator [Candidatus Thorarchaeota archaeon]
MSDSELAEFVGPPDCCDMRGLLTFQILWELRGKELNGQEIAQRIAERRGSKPTPGTIYPALKNLKEKRMIKGRRDGRKIIYSLTPEGEKGTKEAAVYFFRVFGDIVKEIRTKVIIVGDRPSGKPKVKVVVVDESEEEET